jgi:ferritin-like metal-binding protein YciE
MELLDQHLSEALAAERAQLTTLRAHISMTPPGPYRRLLERHHPETRGHAAALATRLQHQTSLLGVTVALAETAAGRLLTLAKGPLEVIRSRSQAERLLKNARDECATEALEIATYDTIEALAEDVDDIETVELARAIRNDEERMLADLRALIPSLTGARTPTAVPITGYDDLNAGQIAARLSELSQEHLAAVLAYERAHRNRRTVIERAEVLTAPEPWEGYDDADVSTVLARLDEHSAGRVRDYESRHRRRVVILEAAQRVVRR